MGYSVDAFLVPFEPLATLYGSQNHDLVTRIERQLQAEVERLNGFIFETNATNKCNHTDADGIFFACPTVQQALHAYVAGTILEPAEYAFSSYRFALRLFCMLLGETLPSDYFDWMRPYGVRFIEVEVPTIGNTIFRAPTIGPHPFPEDWRGDWNIGLLTWQNAREQLQTWQPITVSDDPENRLWEEGICNQYRGWLERAIQQQHAVVLFFE